MWSYTSQEEHCMAGLVCKWKIWGSGRWNYFLNGAWKSFQILALSSVIHSIQTPSSSTFWKLPWRLSGLIMFLCCFDVISVTAAIICQVGQEPKSVLCWTSDRREPGCGHGTVQSHIFQKHWEYFSHSHSSQTYWFLYQVLPAPMWGISSPWNVIKR